MNSSIMFIHLKYFLSIKDGLERGKIWTLNLISIVFRCKQVTTNLPLYIFHNLREFYSFISFKQIKHIVSLVSIHVVAWTLKLRVSHAKSLSVLAPTIGKTPKPKSPKEHTKKIWSKEKVQKTTSKVKVSRKRKGKTEVCRKLITRSWHFMVYVSTNIIRI